MFVVATLHSSKDLIPMLYEHPPTFIDSGIDPYFAFLICCTIERFLALTLLH